MNSTHQRVKETPTVLSGGVPREVRVDDHPNFDRAVRTLRYSDSVAERVAAAQALGNIGTELATPDLIASLFDPEPDVSIAAAAALRAIGDPAVNLQSLSTFFSGNRHVNGSVADVEYHPHRVANSLEVAGSHPLMVVEKPLSNRIKSAVSDSRSNGRSHGTALKNFSGWQDDLEVIIDGFDDADPGVRNDAALAVARFAPERSAEHFALIMERATLERRQRIGRAMVGSGLAKEAIEILNDQRRERVFNALKLLSLIAKAGETQPLVETIEEHSSLDIRRAAVKLLAMSGHPEMATTAVKRRLKI